MRLSEAINTLCTATRADGRSRRTVQTYQEKLGHLLRFLSDPPIEAVTVGDLLIAASNALAGMMTPIVVEEIATVPWQSIGPDY